MTKHDVVTEIRRRVALARTSLDGVLSIASVATNRPYPSLTRAIAWLCEAIERTAVRAMEERDAS